MKNHLTTEELPTNRPMDKTQALAPPLGGTNILKKSPRRAAGGNTLKTDRQMNAEFKKWSDSHYEAVMALQGPKQLELFE